MKNIYFGGVLTCPGGYEAVVEGKKQNYCEETACQDCCDHQERDHGICLDCSQEEDPGEAIDRAMDALEDR